jgi:hypothetical protein
MPHFVQLALPDRHSNCGGQHFAWLLRQRILNDLPTSFLLAIESRLKSAGSSLRPLPLELVISRLFNDKAAAE